jgi:hypothetical protein
MPFDKAGIEASIEVRMRISFGSFDDILSTIKGVESNLTGASKWAGLVDKMGDLVAVAKAISEVHQYPLAWILSLSRFCSQITGPAKTVLGVINLARDVNSSPNTSSHVVISDQYSC